MSGDPDGGGAALPPPPDSAEAEDETWAPPAKGALQAEIGTKGATEDDSVAIPAASGNSGLGLFGLLAEALPEPPPDPSFLPPPQTPARGRKRASEAALSAPPTPSRPVLQLAAMPIPIDRSAYANAQSGSNPNGSMATLYAFRELVDPVPAFSPLYVPGASSTEQAWINFVTGAAARDGSAFATQLLARAQQQNAAYQQPGLTSAPVTWMPVYANPANWWAASDSAYTTVTLDLSLMGQMTGPYAIPGGPVMDLTPPAWANSQGETPLDPGTRLKTLSFQSLYVRLSRPWLDATLLAVSDLYLGGQPAGFYSSGDIQQNAGVLPLLTTGFHLARNVRLEADWAPADRALLARAARTGDPLRFENFLLSTEGGGPGFEAGGDATLTATSTVYQIVAWTSALAPFCPQATR